MSSEDSPVHLSPNSEKKGSILRRLSLSGRSSDGGDHSPITERVFEWMRTRTPSFSKGSTDGVDVNVFGNTDGSQSRGLSPSPYIAPANQALGWTPGVPGGPSAYPGIDRPRSAASGMHLSPDYQFLEYGSAPNSPVSPTVPPSRDDASSTVPFSPDSFWQTRQSAIQAGPAGPDLYGNHGVPSSAPGANPIYLVVQAPASGGQFPSSPSAPSPFLTSSLAYSAPSSPSWPHAPPPTAPAPGVEAKEDFGCKCHLYDGTVTCAICKHLRNNIAEMDG